MKPYKCLSTLTDITKYKEIKLEPDSSKKKELGFFIMELKTKKFRKNTCETIPIML